MIVDSLRHIDPQTVHDHGLGGYGWGLVRRERLAGRGVSWTMVRRWVARVIATYRSWPPAGDWSRIPAGSASTTRSNSRPLAWPTVSSATGESSTSARSPGTAAGSA